MEAGVGEGLGMDPGDCVSHTPALLSLFTSLLHLPSGSQAELAERVQITEAKKRPSSTGPMQGLECNRHSESAT